jgi:V8-like Glu-specific endopeptidase
LVLIANQIDEVLRSYLMESSAPTGVRFDPYMALVALIRIVATGSAPKPSSMGSATGFFFEHEGRRFLVTNRHVVVAEDKGFYPDHLIVRIHSSRESVVPTRDIELQLYDAKGGSIWLEHPTKGVDLAALEIGPLVKETDMIYFLTKEHLLPRDTTVTLGTQVFVVGYPMGLFEPKFYLPIVRTGTLATPYGINFDGSSICLIDANLHPGTSGSPVLISYSLALSAVQDPNTLRKFPSFLIGVNSGVYSMDGVSLGLNAVWYGRLLLDILSKH